jgi:hypothetical protein
MLTETRPIQAGKASRFSLWWIVAVASVVVSVLVASVFSPDMVSGSAQEHLPLVGMIDWFWGLIAVAYLAYVRADRADPALGITVAIVWLAVAVASIAAPEMVTGSDPTRIPIAALTAPIVGCLATGFLSLNAVRKELR